MNIALINNNDIYIFAHLSAILNVYKLDKHLIDRHGSVNK